MTSEQALTRLGASTSAAVREVLEVYAPGRVVSGEVRAVPEGADPLAHASMPAVMAEVGYVDGVTGGNVLLLGVEGARRLAAAMMGADPDEVPPDGELDEMDLSATGEALNQMMSAAAMATSEVLGEEVEIAPPVVRVAERLDGALDGLDTSGRACTVSFTLCGAPCLLVQLIPHAFIVRMTRAYDELTQEYASAPLGDSLGGVRVRVWAELGRTRMPAGTAVGLPPGAVVELDHDVDAPIDLYADGMRVASGTLVVGDDGGLSLRIDSLLGAPAPLPTASTPLTQETY